jgi:hypothetical protein
MIADRKKLIRITCRRAACAVSLNSCVMVPLGVFLLSGCRPLPEFARLDYGDALKLAEREEVLVHGDQDRCAAGDGRTENRDILRIKANVGREVSWHRRCAVNVPKTDLMCRDCALVCLGLRLASAASG